MWCWNQGCLVTELVHWLVCRTSGWDYGCFLLGVSAPRPKLRKPGWNVREKGCSSLHLLGACCLLPVLLCLCGASLPSTVPWNQPTTNWNVYKLNEINFLSFNLCVRGIFVLGTKKVIQTLLSDIAFKSLCTCKLFLIPLVGVLG